MWIQDSQLQDIFKDKVVVQVSDLHIRGMGIRERKVLKILDGLQPDVILLTGDYVAWEGDDEMALTFLSSLHAKVGIWAVMGEYDYSDSRKSCLFCHESNSEALTCRHQVHFLRNSYEKINLEKGTFWIGGIDDAANDEISDRTRFLTDKGKVPAIILIHNPLLFDRIDNNQDVLILAGDTHGGQIPFPRWVWSVMGYKKNALYNYGFFKEGQKKMFVSRGVGTNHIPLRVCSPPEVIVLHFY